MTNGPAHLLVSGDAAIDGGVHHSVERHAEKVDVVAVRLLELIAADQRAQLLVLVLHHADGVFQRTHLHLKRVQVDIAVKVFDIHARLGL